MMPMMSAMNATKTSPSRNIVSVMRAVSPRSGAYRVRAIGAPPYRAGSPTDPSSPRHLRMYPNNAWGTLNVSAGSPVSRGRNPALSRSRAGPGTRRTLFGELAVGQQPEHLRHVSVLRRQDDLGWVEVVVRHGRPAGPDDLDGAAQRRLEGDVVTGLDGRVKLTVELVQLGRGRGIDLELPFAEDPDYHRPSPAPGCWPGAVFPPAEAPPLEAPPLPPLDSICRGAWLALGSSPRSRASSDSISWLAPMRSSSCWM